MTLVFAEGDQVLCFHGPLLYEAKVLKAEHWTDKANHEDGPYYFVHYKGWKQTWDEWVPESRVLKFSDENLKRQADLRETLKTKKAKERSRAAQEKEAAGGTPEKGRKRPRESMADQEEEYLRRPEVRIAIPELLKCQLVEDWENVTKNQKLVRLPRDPNVIDLLKKYENSFKDGSRKSNKDKNLDAYLEERLEAILDGMRVYFDHALGNLLLYRFERQQYVEARKKYPDTPMSELYGAEHLLRLFVQFPSLIAHTNMEQEAVNILKDHFARFLEWMEENYKTIFMSEYDNVSPQYIAQMRLAG
ncbi:MRG-domain-containing protein [Phlyctochytrium arcticum]|nr:MRG-domain-containing protein [Phlyctochytrium arcticum]